ncbi:MAG TPA: MarR family transcriptional regulator [Gaiellaceae bacterium]|nr:MarR family transcriptional regulator [Gaiellaceae bacterium]
MLPADELLDALSTLRRSIRRRAVRPEALSSLTGAQAELVRLLRRRPESSIADAAAELGLAANTVSTLVRQLSEARLLVRRVDDADRRVARLDLPPAVRRTVEAWRDRRVDALEEALAALSPADRRTIDAAVPVLERLAKSLDSAAQAA